jgi:hypothetical protein
MPLSGLSFWEMRDDERVQGAKPACRQAGDPGFKQVISICHLLSIIYHFSFDSMNNEKQNILYFKL